MFYVPLIKSFSAALETGQSQNLFKVSWQTENGNERAQWHCTPINEHGLCSSYCINKYFDSIGFVNKILKLLNQKQPLILTNCILVFLLQNILQYLVKGPSQPQLKIVYQSVDSVLTFGQCVTLWIVYQSVDNAFSLQMRQPNTDQHTINYPQATALDNALRRRCINLCIVQCISRWIVYQPLDSVLARIFL